MGKFKPTNVGKIKPLLTIETTSKRISEKPDQNIIASLK